MRAWREALEEKPSVSSSSDKRRIKELERELRRKDKALAEAAALLILQKKMQDLLGGEDDDMDESAES